MDFSKLKHVTPNDLQTARAVTGKSGTLGISVVNTERNGKRVKLTMALFDALGSPKSLQFVCDGDNLIIGPKIPHCTVSVKFSSGTGANIIYDAGFVQYLTKQFNLDFSARTSIAFRDVEVCSQEFEGESFTFARIHMAA